MTHKVSTEAFNKGRVYEKTLHWDGRGYCHPQVRRGELRPDRES